MRTDILYSIYIICKPFMSLKMSGTPKMLRESRVHHDFQMTLAITLMS